jgi:hypothetical protein
MSKDKFFIVYVKDGSDNSKGMAVHIPPETGHLPGGRIKTLTDAARKLPLNENERLRTEMLVDSPKTLETRELSEYLWSGGVLNADRFIRHLDCYRQGKKPHLFQPRVGITVVMEEEFIGREKPLAALEENISNQISSHLRAPRRYGKSSLMGRLEKHLPHAVMMELSDIGHLSGFLKRLLDRCMRHEKARNCLFNLPEYRTFPDASQTKTNPQVFNTAFYELMKTHTNTSNILKLLRGTMTALADSGIILLIDEFSLFLREMKEKDEETLKDFLDLYHQLRIRSVHPLVSVFAGSSGLSTFIELLGMHALFKDLIPVDIPPVTSTEAGLLAEELFYGMGKIPSPSSIERLVTLTGGDETVPYFVHALAHYTTEQAGLKREISPEDVEAAYYDRLLGPSGNVCFRDFILREKGYPAAYRDSASKILKKLSRTAPDILSEEVLKKLCTEGCEFMKLMTCLEEDYDLVHETDGWRMRSAVIADRWRIGEPWLTIGGKS